MLKSLAAEETRGRRRERTLSQWHLRETGTARLGCGTARDRANFTGLVLGCIEAKVNMRLKALAEIYTMHSFAQLCNLNFLSKFCQFFAKFCKIQQN